MGVAPNELREHTTRSLRGDLDAGLAHAVRDRQEVLVVTGVLEALVQEGGEGDGGGVISLRGDVGVALPNGVRALHTDELTGR